MILLILFLSLWIGIGLRQNVIAIGIVALCFFIYVFKRFNKGVLIVVLGVSLFGSLISFIRPSYPHKRNYTCFVYKVSTNYFLVNSAGERLYCYEKEHPYEVGDILNIKGESEDLSFSLLESSFDFKSYLNNAGVYKRLKIYSSSYKLRTPLRLNAYRKSFLKKFDENTKKTVSAILFSQYEDSNLSSTVSSLHMNRLLSAGGLYFYAFIGVISFALSFLISDKDNRHIIGVILLSFYVILLFPKLSLIRISLLCLFRLINKKLLNRRFESIEMISIVGIAFLLLNYHLACQDSFIIGFMVSITLTLFYNSSFLEEGIRKKVVMITIIYLLFVPFEIKYYQSISPFGIIYQSLISPIFLIFGFLALLSLYGVPLYSVLKWFNSLLLTVVTPLTQKSFAIYISPFNEYLTLLYYALLFTLLYYKLIGFKPFYRPLTYLLIAFSIIYCIPFNNMISAEVDFVNVGQGDCCFIRKQDTAILIDTGGLQYTDLARASLIPFLKKKRIYDIDLVITTHNDFDHNGALTSLKAHFPVKKIMDNYDFENTKINRISFTNYNNHVGEYEDDNDNSLVIGFHLIGYDFLITGDASIKNENTIMKEYNYIPCDILKVGHHGSNTSSSEKFVSWLSPKEAVISVGKNNQFGHPHQTVLNILKKYKIKIRRTDLEGTIKYKKLINPF
ncbi:MAG: DNA internalization-related competence protein ComEC/Rec2 [Bacilli bacterium]|nr:DNA internalization-related competence protein ComEC/Rec2 [Bacilli bacterium]